MKKQFLLTLSFFLVFSVIVTASSWAGQVVTNDIKLWAKQAIAQENALASRTAPPNSVAVLYFNNKSKKSDLKFLEKGLSLMIITDLHKVKGIRLVERVKLQAIMSELGLTASKLTDEKSSARVGKLLGAANLVGGDIFDAKLKKFQVTSNIIDVKEGNIFGRPEVEGKLLDDLFKMEKELVFEIIKLLKVQLTPEEELELKKPLSTNLRAFIYFIKAIEYSDAEDYVKAREYYEKALVEDPGFDMAEIGLLELKELQLYAVRAEAYTEEEEADDIESRDIETEFQKTEVEDIIEESEYEFADFDIYGHISLNLKYDMVVDFEGIGDEIKKTAENDALMETIGNGEYVGGNFDGTESWTSSAPHASSTNSFWSGNYEFGFQTVGQYVEYNPDGSIISSTPMYFQPGILGYDERAAASLGDSRTSQAMPTGEDLSDGFLAYAVQLEEDRMNKKIVDMFDDNFAVQELVQDALEKNTLRARDALFTQIADAQAGRVLIDNYNNWTRVQQYIIRYTQDGQTTVQMLNASLRKGSSDYAGFSTINWTTELNRKYDGDLRNLPWSSWLANKSYDNKPYMISDPNPQADYPEVFPTNMSVEIKNPYNDVLRLSRSLEAPTFDDNYESLFIQNIEQRTLALTNGATNKTSTYTNYYNAGAAGEEFNVGPIGGQTETSYFYYHLIEDEKQINVTTSVIKDIETEDSQNNPNFKDLWDALRANESGDNVPNIGNNCLGITIGDPSSTMLSHTIDVIYIPMSRMLWKTYID